MKDEKRKYALGVGQNNDEEKITFSAFEKRNATAYEQNIWRVISTNATVLADNANSEKILYVWNSTELLGQIMRTCFSPEFFEKKRGGDFFIFTKYTSRRSSFENF